MQKQNTSKHSVDVSSHKEHIKCSNLLKIMHTISYYANL